MLLFYSLLYLLRYDCFALAAPVQNLTALNTQIAPAWVADPGGRGTWGILYSCTFTIFLCVYTAIHLNVPPEESGIRFWLRKTKWVLIAVLAPEIVLYTAFEQWFLKRLNELLDESTDEKMKGWVRNYDLHGLFCHIRKDDIQDKSKADILAKALVCVQVLWVAGQAIERKVAGFPITLLEVHTLVHVVCAIIMYALWVRKPLNVKDPTMVDFRDAPDVLAFMVEYSEQAPDQVGGLQTRPGFRNVGPKVRSLNSKPTIVWYRDPSKGAEYVKVGSPAERPEISSPLESASENLGQERVAISTLFACTYDDVNGVAHYYAVGNSKRPLSYVPTSDTRGIHKMMSGQVTPLGYGPVAARYDTSPLSLVDLLRCRTAEISFSEKDILRLNSTTEFLARIKASADGRPTVTDKSLYLYNDSENVADPLHAVYKNYTGVYSARDLLLLRARNWNGEVLGKIDGETAYLIVAMAAIPAAYGCVHVGALNIAFPSLIERLLWKISCYYLITMAGGIGVMGLLIYLNNIIRQIRAVDIIPKFLSYLDVIWEYWWFTKYLLDWIFLILLGSIALVYVGARFFIVIESFISLRHVPIGVYATPDVNFMNYIPHL